MAIQYNQLIEKVSKPTGELKDACWAGYVAVGTKKKNGKTVPNCVPETSEEAIAHMKQEAMSAKQKKMDHNKNGKIDGEDLAKLREVEEAKTLSAKQMAAALASDKNKAKPKGSVSLKKAPWDESAGIKFKVVYKNKAGKVEAEKDFDTEMAAKKYAERGNKVDKVGGKYVITKVKGMSEAVDTVDRGEYDYEGSMAKNALQTIMRNAEDLMGMLGDDDNLPEWVQAKITKAEDYMSSVREYMQSEMELGEETVVEAHCDDDADEKKMVKGMKKSFKEFMHKKK